MSAALHDWILGLFAAAVVTALAMLLTPEGPVRRVTRFACGVLMLCMVVSPVLRPDTDAYALSLAEYKSAAAELTDSAEETEKLLLRTYIEGQCAAYILDEARAVGIAGGRVEVRAVWGADCWVPYSAVLTLDAQPQQRQTLGGWMEAELGIPAERQTWHGDG